MPTQPFVIPLTTADKASLTKNQMNLSASLFFNQAVQTFKQSFANVWNNPQGLTPQNVFDAHGAGAAQLFANAQALATFINSVAPGTLSDNDVTPPITYVINPDGTVTSPAPAATPAPTPAPA